MGAFILQVPTQEVSFVTGLRRTCGQNRIHVSGNMPQNMKLATGLEQRVFISAPIRVGKKQSET